MKLNVYGTESYCSWILREPVEINTDNYPELEGMSDEEVKEYIRLNASEMKPSNPEWYESLEDELYQMDIRRDKTNNEEMGIIFDNE